MEAVIMDGLRMVWLLLEGQRRKLIKYTYYLKEQLRIRRTPVFQLTTTSYDRPFLLPGAEALPSIQLFERELGRRFETAEDRRRWSEEGARSIVYVKLALKFHTLKFHCNFTAISLKLQPPSADFKQFRF